jgi:hypothetical protein
MPTDPRLNSLVGYVQNSLTGDAQSASVAMLRQELADVRQRASALERSATVQSGAGAPTQASRDGTLYIDQSNLRLYLRVNATWRFLGPFS